jgi:hypothetical protein
MDPNPDPDQTSFFNEFKNVKKIIFFIFFFSFNLPTVHNLHSSVLKIKFFAKILVKILFCPL